MSAEESEEAATGTGSLRLSVVIPCFNESATLPRVLEAVKAAYPPDKEIIVVDDASTDGVAQWIRDHRGDLFGTRRLS